MEPDTAPALCPALADVGEELSEDTPKSVMPERRTMSIAAALLVAPMMMTQTLASNNYPPVVSDMTPLIEDERPEDVMFDRLSKAGLLNQESEIDTANRTRLELLAREYVRGKLSTEEDARLAIVSERVRLLLPRVTAHDFETLEHMLEEAQEIAIADTARRQRLGIE